MKVVFEAESEEEGATFQALLTLVEDHQGFVESIEHLKGEIPRLQKMFDQLSANKAEWVAAIDELKTLEKQGMGAREEGRRLTRDISEETAHHIVLHQKLVDLQKRKKELEKGVERAERKTAKLTA